MQVTAFATPQDRGWRWRIVNYAGEIIEESTDSFATIATAVASGRSRLLKLDIVDRSEPLRPGRRAPHTRRH